MTVPQRAKVQIDLSNGQTLVIVGTAAIYDGWLTVWPDDANMPAETWSPMFRIVIEWEGDRAQECRGRVEQWLNRLQLRARTASR